MRARRPGRAVRGSWSARPAGGAARIVPTVSRTAPRRCSQLSTTRSPGSSPSTARQAVRTSPCRTLRFRAAASAWGIAEGSVTGARVARWTPRRHGRRPGRPGSCPPPGQTGDQPLGREQPVQRRNLGLTTDEPGGRRAGPAGATGAARQRRRRRRVPAERAPVTGPTRSPRRAACGTYARSGAPRGPARGRQRAHQEQDGRFAQRIGRVHVAGQADDRGGLARVDRAADQRVRDVPVECARLPRRWQSPRRRSDRRGPARATAHAPPAAAAAPRPDRAARGCARWRAGPAPASRRGPRGRGRGGTRPAGSGGGSRRPRGARAGTRGCAGPGAPSRASPSATARPRAGRRGPAVLRRAPAARARPAVGTGHLNRPAVDDQPQGSEHLHPHPRSVDCWHRFTPSRTDGVSAEKARARSLTLRRSTWLSSPACAGEGRTGRRWITTLDEFLGHFVADMGAAGGAGLMAIGNRLALPSLAGWRRQPSSSPNAPATTFIT